MTRDDKTYGNLNKGYIKSGHAMLRYHSYGRGPALIMLHGNMQSSIYFDKQVDFFKGFYNVIAVDSRGHGDSSFGVKKLSIALMAEDVLNLMDALEIKQAFILGFSDGGNIALQLGLMAPGRVMALACISPNLDPSGIRSWVSLPIQGLYTACHLLRGIDWFEKKAQILSLMVKGPSITTESLGQIKIPALIMSGEYDIIHDKHIRLIAESIPGARLEIMKGSGHFLLHSNPAKANAVIMNFFSSIV